MGALIRATAAFFSVLAISSVKNYIALENFFVLAQFSDPFPNAAYEVPVFQKPLTLATLMNVLCMGAGDALSRTPLRPVW